MARLLERLKKYRGRSERGFLGLASGADHRPLAKEQVRSNPVTEPKRSQNPKRPPSLPSKPNGCGISENALSISLLVLAAALAGCSKPANPPAPDLSAYTNIPPGTPITITFRPQSKANMPQWVRDGISSVPVDVILDSITSEKIVFHSSPRDTNLTTLSKESVNSIHVNTQ